MKIAMKLGAGGGGGGLFDKRVEISIRLTLPSTVYKQDLGILSLVHCPLHVAP